MEMAEIGVEMAEIGGEMAEISGTAFFSKLKISILGVHSGGARAFFDFKDFCSGPGLRVWPAEWHWVSHAACFDHVPL